jgi:hypothetical protein
MSPDNTQPAEAKQPSLLATMKKFCADFLDRLTAPLCSIQEELSLRLLLNELQDQNTEIFKIINNAVSNKDTVALMRDGLLIYARKNGFTAEDFFILLLVAGDIVNQRSAQCQNTKKNQAVQ